MNKFTRLSIVIGILFFAFNVLPAYANTNSSNSSGSNNSNSSGTNNSNGSGTNNSNGSGSNPGNYTGYNNQVINRSQEIINSLRAVIKSGNRQEIEAELVKATSFLQTVKNPSSNLLQSRMRSRQSW